MLNDFKCEYLIFLACGYIDMQQGIDGPDETATERAIYQNLYPIKTDSAYLDIILFWRLKIGNNSYPSRHKGKWKVKP